MGSADLCVMPQDAAIGEGETHPEAEANLSGGDTDSSISMEQVLQTQKLSLIHI